MHGEGKVVSLLVEAFLKLPQPRLGDDLDLWQAGVQEAAREFREVVRSLYSEGTLQRLLLSAEEPLSRRAAAFALGIVGQMASNPALAQALSDDGDDQVRRFSADSLWEIWFRGDAPEQARELRQALSLPDFSQQIAALDDVVREYPSFAEAYNQRAILNCRRGQHVAAVADCEHVLRLNPHHFGAASGMGQCYLRMNRPHAALRSFSQALQINPNLTHLNDTIQSLKEALGEV